MKFLIRDDDTCAYTNPKELIGCYQKIWNDIPINISITPFRIPGEDKNVPDNYKGTYKALPLENNQELVSFLKEKIHINNINIALHGYYHSRLNDLPEYIDGDRLFEKTLDGKQYLERLLNIQIDTFIPPNNAIAKKGIIATSKNRLNIVGMPSFIRYSQRPVAFKNIIYFIKNKYYRHIYNIKIPYVVKFKDHKEVNYYSITPSQEFDYLKKSLEIISKLRGIFILSVHYHAFKKKLKSGEYIEYAINKLIEQSMRYKNVRYVTYKQLWDDVI